MEPVECYGLEPANYEGKAMPKLIECSIVTSGVYSTMLVIFATWDISVAFCLPCARRGRVP